MSANDKDVAVEKFESLSQDEAQSKHDARNQTMGTVTFTDSDEIFLVPSPSADPRDPLNMSRPAKITFIVLLSIFSSVALCMVSGFGGLLGFYIPVYAEHGATYADITALMTYPSMFMGIGCLFGMPLAMAIGRRPVYLGSMIVLLVGSLLAAYAKDYNWHLGARMVLGLAAGQSEALVPMMIQEIHFLHERSTFLMWQVAIQTLLSAGLTIGASPLAGAIGPKNWYILGGALGIATLVASIFFVPESRYPRTLAAYGQFNVAEGGESEDESRATVAPPVKLSERPALDFTRYEARTWASDMRIFVGGFDWAEGWYGFVNTFQVLLFPNVFWAFCLNGFTIGVNIAIGTTYGNIVTKAPYNWAQSAASYVTAGQVVIALIALPMLGNGSDRIIKWAAKRNGGVHEPENRILPLVFPLIVGVISAVIYGQAGQFPEKYHWFAIVFAYAGYYFGFIGANIVGITYLLDSYPARSGPILIVITAFRGFVSFGTSYGVAKFIETDGYDGSFGAYAGITALLGLLGIPIFFYGKRIRSFTGRFAMKSKTGVPSMSH